MENNPTLASIIEKQKKRYALLLRIYELTDGDETKMVLLEAPDGVNSSEVQSIVDYLAGEGLVESLADEAPLVRTMFAEALARHGLQPRMAEAYAAEVADLPTVPA